MAILCVAQDGHFIIIEVNFIDQHIDQPLPILGVVGYRSSPEKVVYVSAISKCRFSPKLNVVFYGAAYRCYTALYTTSLAGLKPVKPWFISLFQA